MRLDHQFQRSERRPGCPWSPPDSVQRPGSLFEPLTARQRYLLRVQRGQGRAVGAAEDHMVCLELFLKIEIILGMSKTSLGTMLSH